MKIAHSAIRRPPPEIKADKTWKAAQAFEAQFLKSLLEQAFEGLSGEGPMGSSGPGASAWRSFLIDEHARSFAASGGIGLAAAVYRTMQTKTGENSNVRR